MRIAIYGTGGAGGYFGAHLARAGEDVIFIARGEHLRAILEKGLRVETAKGEILVHPAQATADPAQVGAVDLVIVGVKTWQVGESASAMQPMMGRETFVVTLQNGVEAAPQLAAVLGADRILGGLCGTFSLVAGPGHIRSIGETNFIKFGELDNRPSDRTRRLRETFERAGVKAEIPPDIQVALWEKLLLVSYGGLGAIARAPVGILRALPETRRMIERGMREILAVARARQIPLADSSVEKTMALLDSLVPGGTTSLQRDIAAGKPSELDAWNGAVVRLGREAGVATPLHEFIYHSLLPSELRARGKVQFPS
ncbi:MAG TPA: 2-dehydropantoate 2-reductase [Pyrinomonadaceae bacterium]|jgi:2-dehydropantoate 2-reductase|nr:2-dehydropantoate 2-reductase [Pyrinomonadaceae bacterium]